MSEPTYHIWKYYNDNDSKMIRAINESDALKILWRAIGDDFFKPDTTFTVKIEKTTISADDCPFGVGQIRLDAYITPVNVK